MPDVGKQTLPTFPMRCFECGSLDTLLRLPRDTGKKESFVDCNDCGFEVLFP